MALTALLLAWLTGITLIQLTGALTPQQVASSPNAIADGRLWTLLTSSLVTDGSLGGLQIALVAVFTALVLYRDGAVVWWVSALAGHVGSALVAYAVIGVAIAFGSGSARAVAAQPDYGISCVFAALNGALFATAIERRREGRADTLDSVLIAFTVPLVGYWFVTLSWYGAEHLYATVLGALATHWRKRTA